MKRSNGWAFVCALPSLLLASAPVGADNLENYAADLARWEQSLRALARRVEAGVPPGALDPEITRLRSEAAERRAVRLDQASLISVDLGWLGRALGDCLASDVPNQKAALLRQTADTLALLRERLGAFRPRAGPGGDPRAIVRAVLSSPEYHYTSAKPSLLAKVLLWLYRWLGKHLSLAPTLSRVAAAFRWFVLASFAALALVIIFLLPRRWASRQAHLALRPAAEYRQAQLTSQQALASALRALSARDYREALRLLYLALVLRLAERGLFAYHPSRTNWEYARELAAKPEIASTVAAREFEQATRLFEQAYFGGRLCSPAEVQRMRRLVEQAYNARQQE